MSEYAARQVLYRIGRNVSEQEIDRALSSAIHYKVTDKLSLSRKKGRHGWWNEKLCSIADLEKLLIEHKDKGDPMDLIIIQSMIDIRRAMKELAP